MCNSCASPLKNSKYYQVICRDATEHEDRIKEIDEMQENSNEEDKEKKVDDIATLKAKLHDLEERMKDVDDNELNDLLDSIKAQLEELEKLNPDEETKKSKSAMAEFIGIDNSHSAGIDADDAIDELVTLQSQRHRNKKLKHSQSYNILTLEPYESVTHSGDELFIRLGSTDEPTKGNAKDDEFLKSLGSTD